MDLPMRRMVSEEKIVIQTKMTQKCKNIYKTMQTTKYAAQSPFINQHLCTTLCVLNT